MSEGEKDKDSMKNILTISLMVCFACSIVVSSAAVFLKPQREANKDLDRNKNILEAAGLYDKEATQDLNISLEFEKFEIRVVDLQEKRVLSDVEAADLGIDSRSYDQRKASKNPEMSESLESEEDIASISRRARYSILYLLKEDGDIKKVVLPVHGYGLWSTLYGFVALRGDMNTISGITFYEHGETAGLGGEIDNAGWKAQWAGKKIYNEEGVALKVIKGVADAGSSDFKYQIDGLSGATLTSRGVENLVTYWMGDEGFGPILDDFRG